MFRSLVPSAIGSELSDVIVVDEDVLRRCLPPGMIPEKMGVAPFINYAKFLVCQDSHDRGYKIVRGSLHKTNSISSRMKMRMIRMLIHRMRNL